MKNKMTLALFALFLGVGTVQTALADLYLEPYVGYVAGKWKSDTAEQKFKGPAYGLRLGYSILGLAVGLEYEGGKLKDDSTPNNDINATNLGAFASYEFPILLRVYGAYFPKSKAEFSSSSVNTTFEGGGMKLGVGFTALPFLAINLEYATNKYDAETGSAISGEVKSKHYGINISLPLNL